MRHLPFVLALVAGTVDATTFLGLAHLFAGPVTGNLVILAASLASGQPQGAAGKLLSVPVLLLAVALAATLGQTLRRRGRSPLRGLLIAEALCLAAALTLTLREPDPESLSGLLAGMLLVAAMGLQNALNPVVLPDAPPTTVMTTTATRLVTDLVRLWMPDRFGGGQHPAGLTAQVHQLAWPAAAFLAGCAVGGFGFVALGFYILAVPLILIGLEAAIVRAP